ncbi:MAG: toxin-antitoxin system TumE family protein, partial [Candidatus Entotheonellia bacterium]
YSFHWERRAIDGRIYRHDNAPHKRWQSVATFPRLYLPKARNLYSPNSL